MKISLLVFSLIFAAFGHQVRGLNIPERVTDGSLLGSAPYNSAGLVRATVGNKTYFGSGAVAEDGRLLFGCAHVVYDNGRWANRLAFARRYSSQFGPLPGDFVTARGFRFLEGYAANRYADYFDYDFSVAYTGAAESFGPALDLVDDAYDLLTDPGRSKMILGYPSYLDADFSPGYYYMHRTGPFDDPFTEDYGYYSYGLPCLVIDDVSTGPGNSGGPVLVQQGGNWKLAGILVSGSRFSAGIYSLADEAKAAASDLLANVVGVDGYDQQVPYARRTVLRDNSARSTAIRFAMVPRASQTVRISLYLDLATVFGDDIGPGEIAAELRSPTGRVYSVPVDAIDPTTQRVEVSSSAEVSEAGRWTLLIRDKSPGTASVLRRAVLSMTSR